MLYRKWKESKEDSQYVKIIKEQVKNSRKEAEADGITAPITLAEYIHQLKQQPSSTCSNDDLYDEDEYYEDSSDSEDIIQTSSDREREDLAVEDSGMA